MKPNRAEHLDTCDRWRYLFTFRDFSTCLSKNIVTHLNVLQRKGYRVWLAKTRKEIVKHTISTLFLQGLLNRDKGVGLFCQIRKCVL